MGRPPIGKKSMTRAERQARWRKRKRLGLLGRPPKLSASAAPEPPADLGLIEQLTRERDQARRELELALPGVQPRAVGPDNPSRCFVCLRPRSEVKVMLDLSRRRQEVFLCDGCIDQLSRMSNARVGQAPAG
jgi:hypothetical protein